MVLTGFPRRELKMAPAISCLRGSKYKLCDGRRNWPSVLRSNLSLRGWGWELIPREPQKKLAGAPAGIVVIAGWIVGDRPLQSPAAADISIHYIHQRAAAAGSISQFDATRARRNKVSLLKPPVNVQKNAEIESRKTLSPDPAVACTLLHLFIYHCGAGYYSSFGLLTEIRRELSSNFDVPKNGKIYNVKSFLAVLELNLINFKLKF